MLICQDVGHKQTTLLSLDEKSNTRSQDSNCRNDSDKPFIAFEDYLCASMCTDKRDDHQHCAASTAHTQTTPGTNPTIAIFPSLSHITRVVPF